MNYYRSIPKRNKKHRKFKKELLLAAVVAGIAIVFVIFMLLKSEPESTHTDLEPKTEQADSARAEPELPPAVDLQPVLDSWLAGQPGDFGIVIYDPVHKKVVAEHQPNQAYFAASIYKLYVAYLALMDIEAGLHDPNEIYLAGQTRQKCIEEMIRSSDSPCAETMLNEMGHDTVNQRLEDFGFVDTSFPAFVTSAHDAAIILQRLQANQDLNEQSTQLLRTVLREQIYRSEGMPASSPEGVFSVKTGFYETGWHDTGLLTLPSGREFIVTYLSKNAGSAQVSNFGETIYNSLINNNQ